ncbi:MAG TPA: D-glycero-beta-D-manno-heptose-7-phosphate kinase [Acidobacteriota bacterium]|jgi:D-beta-D-heptose 7-phosphate kinase/D-beta-D-heptose 1-phosphate adenosyltransferase
MQKDWFLKLALEFAGKKILVVGDVMLDVFLFGEVCRISPEAPVPVVEVREEVYRLGGAANVARNIRALGGMCLIAGVIGSDDEGDHMIEELGRLQIETAGVVCSRNRKTTKKTRIIAGAQQVCRADHEDKSPLAAQEQRAVAAFLEERISGCDAVVVSDYAKGFISADIFRLASAACRRHQKTLVVDPKIKNFSFYQDATVITPNQGEAEVAAQIDIHDEQSLRLAGTRLLEITRAQAVLVTRGRAGMALFERGKEARQIPTAAREVFDVTGAGDTVIASLSLALSSGADFWQAADIANHAAGIVVAKLGTATASVEEIAESMK